MRYLKGHTLTRPILPKSVYNIAVHADQSFHEKMSS